MRSASPIAATIFAGSSGGWNSWSAGRHHNGPDLSLSGHAGPGFVGPEQGVYDYVNDHVVIANAGSQTVQVLDGQNLAVLATLGTPGVAGSDNAHFNDPTAVTFDGTTDQIIVADTGNDRLQVFNAATFAYVETIGISGGSDARLAAAGNTASTRRAASIRCRHGPALCRRYRQSAGPDLRPATGPMSGRWAPAGLAGSDNAHFNAPKVTVNAAANEILVADSGNSRVQRFDATTLAYKGTIGGAGLSVGQFGLSGSAEHHRL
jgi:DNA-binding beta-propeller fold protein YncE